jgi:hypothetical protein
MNQAKFRLAFVEKYLEKTIRDAVFIVDSKRVNFSHRTA